MFKQMCSIFQISQQIRKQSSLLDSLYLYADYFNQFFSLLFIINMSPLISILQCKKIISDQYITQLFVEIMISKAIKRSFATAGKLLTWGETTFGWGREINENFGVPDYVEGFNNVTKVATGPYHMLFSTSNNQVYSVGLGSNGRLGNNSVNNAEVPENIDHLNQVQIKQLAAGCRHSLALTSTGTVYSWGYGGRAGGVFKYLPFLETSSPLGLGQSGDIYIPTVVQKLKEKINHITAGSDLSLAVGQSGKVYGWGEGIKYLNQEASSQPRQMQQISYFLDSHHAHVKRVKSAGKNAFILLDNGKLYVVGRNNDGVFATRVNPKIRYDEKIETLTQIVNDDLHGEKILNFKVSSNSLIFITDAGSVYFSGMGTHFRPQKFPIKSGNAKSIFATYDSVGVIDNQGRIEFLNDQFIENSVKKGNVFFSQEQRLKNAIKIGGSHRLRYAIVSN